MELIHATLKTLEWYKKRKSRYLEDEAGEKGAKGALDKDIQEKIQAAESFDFDRYFYRLASNK